MEQQSDKREVRQERDLLYALVEVLDRQAEEKISLDTMVTVLGLFNLLGILNAYPVAINRKQKAEQSLKESLLNAIAQNGKATRKGEQKPNGMAKRNVS